MQMIFYKAHGTGNDFIILENKLGKPLSYFSSLSEIICQRHYSVGADGLILLSDSKIADSRVTFINSDGTVGEMCGNGARCAAAFLSKKHGKNKIALETDVGIVVCTKISEKVYSVTIHEIKPIWSNQCLSLGTESFLCSYIEVGSQGVPHLIVFSNELYSVCNKELLPIAKKLRYSRILPKGANVTFCSDIDGVISAKTYERGVEDFTLSCGTASAATAVAIAAKHGKMPLNQNIAISFPGGEITVEIAKQQSFYSATIIGHAEVTFTGKIDICNTN